MVVRWAGELEFFNEDDRLLDNDNSFIEAWAKGQNAVLRECTKDLDADTRCDVCGEVLGNIFFIHVRMTPVGLGHRNLNCENCVDRGSE